MDHKIYDYPHKETPHVMFRGKTLDVMNMVLAMTTYSQILKNVVFKENEPPKNKSLAKW
jgi:hypothetical protein